MPIDDDVFRRLIAMIDALGPPPNTYLRCIDIPELRASVLEEISRMAANSVYRQVLGRTAKTDLEHADLFDQVDGADHAALMSLGIVCEPSPEPPTSAASS